MCCLYTYTATLPLRGSCDVLSLPTANIDGAEKKTKTNAVRCGNPSLLHARTHTACLRLFLPTQLFFGGFV